MCQTCTLDFEKAADVCSCYLSLAQSKDSQACCPHALRQCFLDENSGTQRPPSPYPRITSSLRSISRCRCSKKVFKRMQSTDRKKRTAGNYGTEYSCVPGAAPPARTSEEKKSLRQHEQLCAPVKRPGNATALSFSWISTGKKKESRSGERANHS